MSKFLIKTPDITREGKCTIRWISNGLSLLLISSFLLVIISACNETPSAVIQIDDSSKPLAKTVTVDLDSSYFVHKISMHVEGHINDTAKVGKNNLIYPGIVDTILNCGDHYSGDYYFQYDPKAVTEGSLKVTIAFIGTKHDDY